MEAIIQVRDDDPNYNCIKCNAHLDAQQSLFVEVDNYKGSCWSAHLCEECVVEMVDAFI